MKKRIYYAIVDVGTRRMVMGQMPGEGQDGGVRRDRAMRS